MVVFDAITNLREPVVFGTAISIRLSDGSQKFAGMGDCSIVTIPFMRFRMEVPANDLHFEVPPDSA